MTAPKGRGLDERGLIWRKLATKQPKVERVRRGLLFPLDRLYVSHEYESANTNFEEAQTTAHFCMGFFEEDVRVSSEKGAQMT